MKCVKCGEDAKYKDRSHRACPYCKAAFVFEPKSGDPVTDMLFHNAVKAVSSDGQIRWGVEHLYYEICRKKRKKSVPLAVVGVTVGMAVFYYGLLGLGVMQALIVWPVGIVLPIVILVMLASRFRKMTVPISLDTFNGLWERWRKVHATPGLIVRAPEQKAPKDLESDIGDYSFDRAVICDRAITVDLLVANNFHFENNCAILSIGGYPKGPFEMIRKMLKRNPRLQVFAIHDSTPAGCRMAQKLATAPDWFGGKITIIDLGLRPNHAKPFRGLLLDSEDGLVEPTDGIRPGESKWLTKYRLELAAVRPEQVLKRMFHGLTAHKNDPYSDSGGVMYCGSFDSDGGGSDGIGDGGGDAFG